MPGQCVATVRDKGHYTIQYDGHLPADIAIQNAGKVDLIFALYATDLTDDDPFWTETQHDVSVDPNGSFRVRLGLIKSLPSERKETQHFYWRKSRVDRLQKFATVKIYFRVDWCRYKRGKVCAITRDNAEYVEQELKGIKPIAAIRAEFRRRRP